MKAVDNKLTDQDHFNLGELVESLHILADQLTRVHLRKQETFMRNKFRSWKGN